MELEPEEPPAGPLHLLRARHLLSLLVECAPQRQGAGALVIAIDGRGGAGKSSLATLMAAARPGSVIVHTDDIAWHHSYFGWAEMLAEEVLSPIRRGEAVDFRPAAWVQRGRPGSIVVPGSTEVVILEGTGVLQRRLRSAIDASIWVQVDRGEAARRLLERDGDDPAHLAFVEDWNKEERDFLRAERPWSHVNFIVASQGQISSAGEPLLLVAAGPVPPRD